VRVIDTLRAYMNIASPQNLGGSTTRRGTGGVRRHYSRIGRQLTFWALRLLRPVADDGVYPQRIGSALLAPRQTALAAVASRARVWLAGHRFAHSPYESLTCQHVQWPPLVISACLEGNQALACRIGHVRGRQAAESGSGGLYGAERPTFMVPGIYQRKPALPHPLSGCRRQGDPPR